MKVLNRKKLLIRALQSSAEMLRMKNKEGKAQGYLKKAKEIFKKIGAKGWLKKVEKLWKEINNSH